MRIYKIIFLIYLVLFSSCTSLNREKPFFFVQITDPQFGFSCDTGDIFIETALYEKAINAVNRLKPAFTVITGDFVNDRSNQGQWSEFNRITGLVNQEIPVYLIPGNHDIGQDPSYEEIEKYKERIGKDRFSFDYNNTRFIGINSTIIKSGKQELEGEQFSWIEEQLSGFTGMRHLILFSHHPFFITSPDEAESYSNIAPGKRQLYLRLFNEAGVDAIFAGHYHNNSYGKYNDIEMITTSAAGKPLGDAPSGLRVVKVHGNLIESEYFPLDSIPEKIKIIK